MRRLLSVVAFGALALLAILPEAAFAQGRRAVGEAVARPVPRWPDGHVYIGPAEGGRGTWSYLGNDGMLLIGDELRPNNPPIPDESLKRPSIDEVPFQPWARALFEYRMNTMLEPYTRCHPGAGARMPGTAYGTVLIEFPELQRFFVMQTGGPHSYRTVYMDGRPHPQNLSPSYFGHAVGHWEGDTLVIDSVGFNERMWIEWRGVPHTEQLHLIERVTRLSNEWIRWEFTIDDPGAYTAAWSSGYYLRFDPEGESFEFVCQDNNLASDLMVADDGDAVDRSPFVP